MEKIEKNSIYWAYNLPLQVWPRRENDEDEQSKVIGARILNYMPRKERCAYLELENVLGEQTREEFFNTAAMHYENMAKLMRRAAIDENFTIYYHDRDPTKD